MTEFAYDEHLVAFFDILGFEEFIATAQAAEAAIERIKFFNEALLGCRQILNMRWSSEVDESAVKMFSDCICVSIPAKPENVDAFFQSVTYVQAEERSVFSAQLRL